MTGKLGILRRALPWLGLVALLALPSLAFGQDLDKDFLGSGAVAMADQARDVPVATSLKLILILTALSLLPAVVLVMTPFTRFIIVFSLLRQALGLQQSPPNQVLIGLALFLSILVMRPTLDQVQGDALKPFMAGDMPAQTAIDAGLKPMETFMLENTRRDDLATMIGIARLPMPETRADLDALPLSAVVSAYVLSELKTAFVIAFKIYLPFLAIDMVVATVLMGMGMMMLPPVTVSLPFKLLLFVLMDGWTLLVQSLASGF